MASAFSHAFVGLSLGVCFYKPGVPKNVWLMGAVCAALPDLDVVGFRFGVHYGDFWGHRGFTHSFGFAALLASAVLVIGYRRGVTGLSLAALWAYLFLATASHGFLDAFTDGGLGVAFFSPFDNGRYFFPWRPILVSPIGIGNFFSARGSAVLRSEMVWVWLPATMLAVLALVLRRIGMRAAG